DGGEFTVTLPGTVNPFDTGWYWGADGWGENFRERSGIAAVADGARNTAIGVGTGSGEHGDMVITGIYVDGVSIIEILGL
ncbi:MAG: hypothetical protein FWF80_00425, partial [Defluviitaleaceae bacterium]|nr:hypothetical protein [Defluviitaleaceae bacterium]